MKACWKMFGYRSKGTYIDGIIINKIKIMKFKMPLQFRKPVPFSTEDQNRLDEFITNSNEISKTFPSMCKSLNVNKLIREKDRSLIIIINWEFTSNVLNLIKAGFDKFENYEYVFSLAEERTSDAFKIVSCTDDEEK
jgi:hypothetical protein|tara:strand:- start:478 stop:888 length:411 start_codon:yes stop_codon:yes gene_type:complete